MKFRFNRKNLLVILCLLYLISFLSIVFLNQIVKNNFKLFETSHRINVPVNIKLLFQKELKFKPEQIQTDGNNLFVLALPNNEVVIYDSNANKVDSQINKVDTAVKSQHIINFYASNDTVDIIDSKNLLVKSFNYQNKLKRQIKLKNKILRAFFFSHNKVIIETLGRWDKEKHFSIFKLIDLKQNITKDLSGIIPVADYNGLIYDGFFIPNRHGAFYINYYYNSIISLDSLGSIRYKVHTIDDLPLPTVKISDLGWATYSGDVNLANFSATTDQSFLYILSNTQQKISANLFGYYVDRYDLKNGTYRGSFLLPQIDSTNPGKICFFKNNLYILYKNKLVCYQIKFI